MVSDQFDAAAAGWSDTEIEIMEATYNALLEHGYADLSISRIAEQLGKSKASIYYHYDSKEALMVAFLDFAVDQLDAAIGTDADDGPSEELAGILEQLLPLDPDEEQRQQQRIIVELRSRAVTNQAFHEQFTRFDEQLVATIRDVVVRGIEAGEFRDVDPTRVAEHVAATATGAAYQAATADRDGAVAAARVALSAYLDAEVRADS